MNNQKPTIEQVILLLLLIIGTTFAQAAVFAILFNWFVADTFGIPSISYAESFGGMLIVAFVKYRYSKEVRTPAETLNAIGQLYCFYFLTLVIGYVVTLF
ncbi:MAG: hypothetical protein ACQEUT_18470 [Bacillota bacterium]